MIPARRFPDSFFACSEPVATSCKGRTLCMAPRPWPIERHVAASAGQSLRLLCASGRSLPPGIGRPPWSAPLAELDFDMVRSRHPGGRKPRAGHPAGPGSGARPPAARESLLCQLGVLPERNESNPRKAPCADDTRHSNCHPSRRLARPSLGKAPRAAPGRSASDALERPGRGLARRGAWNPGRHPGHAGNPSVLHRPPRVSSTPGKPAFGPTARPWKHSARILGPSVPFHAVAPRPPCRRCPETCRVMGAVGYDGGRIRALRRGLRMAPLPIGDGPRSRGRLPPRPDPLQEVGSPPVREGDTALCYPPSSRGGQMGGTESRRSAYRPSLSCNRGGPATTV